MITKAWGKMAPGPFYTAVERGLDYPGSVRWQHVLAPQICLVVSCSADVTTRAALPQNKVEAV